ncbi:Bug family tripartite tricarboxylate transporter substrate binding protein [Geminicoccus roseus]|uniref:Bug family tripartite tricarboxylate transporter substrate binding protein n=1 Tax=Geminicoccus roseus TaxID=404900 RepID=UPI00042934EF|nr:tripartite tricarboxylate transporter substrate binding protein [Geminicoccus roseus]
MHRRLLGALLCTGALFGLSPATADAAWPEKPVEVIVPFGPGGSSDLLARLVQQSALENELIPQPITVINQKGHFSVGATQVKNAEPDGYTFLVLHIALLAGEVIDPGKGLSYRDFEPVALTGGFCLYPVVPDNSKYQSLDELMADAQENPNSILLGVNIGAINHMAGVMLEQTRPGAKFRFVQIGGGAENYAALKGEQTQVAVLSDSEYQNFKSGGVRALGYTGPERSTGSPDVPTVRELGYEFDFCVDSYWFAPKGTPAEAVEGMADMLEKAMATDTVKQGMERLNLSTNYMRGEEFEARLNETFERIEPVAEAARPQQ